MGRVVDLGAVGHGTVVHAAHRLAGGAGVGHVGGVVHQGVDLHLPLQVLQLGGDVEDGILIAALVVVEPLGHLQLALPPQNGVGEVALHLVAPGHLVALHLQVVAHIGAQAELTHKQVIGLLADGDGLVHILAGHGGRPGVVQGPVGVGVGKGRGLHGHAQKHGGGEHSGKQPAQLAFHKKIPSLGRVSPARFDSFIVAEISPANNMLSASIPT